MLLHTEPQGTPEWITLRLKKFTASEAAAMKNESKYTTRDELLHMKATGKTKPVPKGTQYIFDKGHEAEALARPIIEKMVKADLCPVVGSLEVEGIPLLASFDGLTVDDTLAFEHKLWSEWRYEYMKDGKVPPEDEWQLEQQCLVSGADTVKFTISNLVDKGEKRREPLTVTYKSKKTIRKKLIAAWKLFDKDLEEYKKNMDETETEAVEGEVKKLKIKSLPALKIELTGTVKNNTVAVYTESADSYLAKIKTTLTTDQDFADAEANIKFCDAARKQIKMVKDNALAETITIKEAFEAFDEIDEKFRLMSKNLTGSVKTKKDQIKEGIINEAKLKLDCDIQEANEKLSPYRLPVITADFKAAAKNKRTIKSLQSSVNAALTNAQLEIQEVSEVIMANKKILDTIGEGYDFLFNDAANFIEYETDALMGLVNGRIATYEAEQEEKKAKEKEAFEAADEANQKLLNTKVVDKIAESFNVDATDVELTVELVGGDQEHVPDELDATYAEYGGYTDDSTEMQDQYSDGTQNADVVKIPVDKIGDIKNEAYYSLRNLGFDKNISIRFVSAVADNNVTNIVLVK